MLTVCGCWLLLGPTKWGLDTKLILAKVTDPALGLGDGLGGFNKAAIVYPIDKLYDL